MGFDIPNSADVPQTAVYGNGAMAKAFRSDIAILEAALEGYRPTSGCQVTPGTNVGTVQVAAGTAIYTDQSKTVAAANNIACCANADTVNPKWILYELDTSQVLQANIGTAAANPIPPTPTAGRVVVAAVFVPANATVVDAAISVATGGNAKIIDKRATRSLSNDFQFYRPVYTTVTDGVTRNTSTTWNAGAINLNTLVGAQNVALTSAAGLPTTGAIVAVHAATDYIIVYNGIATNTLQNCTAFNANGNPAGSVVMANGDAVSNNKIITSATATTWSSSVGSYITGSATQIQVKGTSAATVGSAGTLPASAGQYIYTSQGTLAAGTGLTITTAQLQFTYTAVPGIKSLDIWAIAGGGGGCSGQSVAAITTNANGGGGGGPGGVSHVTLSALDALLDGPAQLTFSLPQGGRGGATAGGAANAGSDGGQPYFFSSVTHIMQLCGGGKGATGTTGGNNGWGTESASGATFKGGNGAIGGTGAATQGYDTKNLGGCTPPGGGGGGGLTGSGSVYLAAATGGGGWQSGFLTNGANGGNAGGQGAVGSNGGSYTGNYTQTFPLFGGGGGGGGGRNTLNVSGGAGGNGGLFGAGGGGGGNGTGTGNGGAGGDGADGCILVVVNA